MPRNEATGVYDLPAGAEAVTGATIASSKYNMALRDIQAELNTPPSLKAKTSQVTAPYQRFLSTKLGDVLSAADFGVRPDIAADQSAALNSMIGAVLDSYGEHLAGLKQVPHEIDLGPGTIRLENPLTPLPVGGTMRGRGASVSKLLAYGAFNPISVVEYEAGGSTPRYHNAMHIADFAVCSMDNANPVTTGLKLRGLIRNSAISRVQVQGAVVSFDIDRSWTLILEHCAGMGVSGTTQSHVLIHPNTGAVVLDGGRYDLMAGPGVHIPVGSDQIELIIQNDCAVQFGSSAAVKVASARTVHITDSFFEGNCIGNPSTYYLDITGSGSTLSSCRVTGSVMNNLADANRDGLGVARFDGFQSVEYDTSDRWVRNGVKSTPVFGPNVQQARVRLGSSHTILSSDAPFVGENRRLVVEQVARPARHYGQDMGAGGFGAEKGTADFGSTVGGPAVKLGAYNGTPAVQGAGTGSNYDLVLNPHDGAVHVPALVPRTMQTSSSITPSKSNYRYVVDTTAGGRVVTLSAFEPGTTFEVVKSVAANNLVFSPGSTGTINGADGDKSVAAVGRYTVSRVVGGWIISHQALA